MEAMGTISAGAIVVKKYQAGTTIGTAGIPLISAGAADTDLAGVEPAAASTALTVGSAGLALDTTGTIAATGITDTNDILVSVAVNPDLIIKCKMSASSTADTALTPQSPSAADATGADTAITSLDEGIIWGYSGANKGILRRATDTTGGVAINFENGITTDDQYLHAGCGMPGANSAAALFGPDLTTDLTQGIAEVVNPADTDLLATFDVILGTEDDDGANNSFWLFVQNQSSFGSNNNTA
jgi:hypothetical protein